MISKKAFGDFAGAINALAEERGIDKDTLFKAVEASIAAAYKKEYGNKSQVIRAELNPVNGDMKFWLRKEVVDESVRDFTEGEDNNKPQKENNNVENKLAKINEEGIEIKLPRFNEERDITLEEAQKRDPDIKVGDTIEEELPTYTDFGRVAAQTAKQVIMQRIRESERENLYNENKEKEGQIVNGRVHRVEGRTVYIDLGKSIGVLLPGEQVRGERYEPGQHIKVFIEKVELDSKGPGVKLSRIHPDMVKRLFEMEVPEIFSGIVEIKAVAREAGSRSKIAVFTEDDDVDAVGSCVGQKGIRVNAVIDALGGEKIDIVEWSPDPIEFIVAALSPAQVSSVELDEENKEAKVIVPDDQLSLAIGKRGQNVRLAVKLTGWNLDVRSESGNSEEVEKTDNKEESIEI